MDYIARRGGVGLDASALRRLRREDLSLADGTSKSGLLPDVAHRAVVYAVPGGDGQSYSDIDAFNRAARARTKPIAACSEVGFALARRGREPHRAVPNRTLIVFYGRPGKSDDLPEGATVFDDGLFGCPRRSTFDSSWRMSGK